MGAKHNGTGVRGIAPAANFKMMPHEEQDDICAKLSYVRASMPAGGVVLFEMQIPATTGQENYGPIEINASSHDCITHTVGLGYIVVEAAGNSGEYGPPLNLNTVSLPHAPFAPQNDSGAIVVGAGIPTGTNARKWNNTSTYGARINVQGWGDSVWTTMPNQSFTKGAGGTSAASAMVAGVVALLQSIHKYSKGVLASPAAVRGSLVLTGKPQRGTLTNWIGPLPDASQAAARLGLCAEKFCHNFTLLLRSR